MVKFYIWSTCRVYIPRIFCRGFPQVVDPRHRGLGVQPPDTDKFLYLLYHLVAYFNSKWLLYETIMQLCIMYEYMQLCMYFKYIL